MDDGMVVGESVEGRLTELAPLVRGDTVLDAIAIAIAVESSFGIVLADEDIVPEQLCSPEALIGTVSRYLDGA
jgi:hypothetical protein